jgi:hypothetical protein
MLPQEDHTCTARPSLTTLTTETGTTAHAVSCLKVFGSTVFSRGSSGNEAVKPLASASLLTKFEVECLNRARILQQKRLAEGAVQASTRTTLQV